MGFSLGDIFVTLKAKTEGLEAGLQKIQQVADEVDRQTKGLGRFADGLKNTGEKLSLVVTAPLLAIAGAGFKASADFDKTMAQVGIASGAAGSELVKLKKLAEEMGATTVYSAQDASQAMLALAKGGMTSAQIQGGALQATMTLAAAGSLELGAAAEYVTNGLNMFGLEAKDANSVAAALAGGANASTASVESMGLALSQVGPGAKLAGLSLQETVAALAAFDNAGIKGSDAGTSLKTMLLGLVPQTDAAKEAMSDLGLKFTDSNGKFDSLATIAEKLKSKLGGLSAEQQQVALKTMFGTDAFRAAAILMGEGEAGIKKYTAATSDLTSAQTLANSNMEGSAGAIERAKGAWETFIKIIGDVVAPAFASILEFLARMAEKFSNLSPGVQTFIVVLGGILAVVGPMLIMLGMLANAIIGISAALALFNLSLGPILLVVAGLAALVAIGILVWKNWDDITKFFVKAWEWVQDAFAAGINWIKEHWDWLLAIMLGPIGIFVGLVIKHWDSILAAAQAAWNGIVAGANWVGGVIAGVWNWISNAAAGAWNFVVGAASSAWGAVIGIWNAATGFFGGIWNGIVSTAGGIVGGIANAFGSAFDGAKNIARGAMNWVVDKVNSVISSINNIAGKVGVPKIGNIARLANGAMNFAGGLARVGELGPELVSLPAGSQVYSNTKSRNMMSGLSGSGGSRIVNNIYMADANITSPHVADQYATLIGDGIISRLGKSVRI